LRNARDGKQPKVFIIGIDGATFDLIKPWAESGKLPTFKRLLDGGVHGNLKSTFPPITAAAWTSFMTGMNPGKHGLYDFIEPQSGSYQVRYTNAKSRLAKTIWQLLSEAGMSVGVINVPMTYPPEPVNGFVISGLDAPEGSKAITYPSDLYQELAGRFGKVGQAVRYLGYLATDQRRDAVLRSLEEMDEHYLRMTEYLLGNHPVDVAMVVFTSTDTVQHFYWHYMDPEHPHHDPAKVGNFGGAILAVYQRMDRFIRSLTAGLTEDTTVVLMSDHGFRSTSGRIVHLNQYLAQLGLLKFQEANMKWCHPTAVLDFLIKKGDALLRRRLSSYQKGKVAQLFPQLRKKWESHAAGLSNIDWKNTKAYCYEVITCPSGIWINLKGARPQGTVEPGADYERLLQFLTEKLYDLKDPVSGKQLIKQVYRKEEIYRGPYLGQAPDLTVAWWAGITFVGKPSFSDNGGGKTIEYIGSRPLAGGEWTGIHASDGVLLLTGKALKSNEILQGAEIIDLAPTLLYLLGIPPVEEMDGRILREAFIDEFIAPYAAFHQALSESHSRTYNKTTYSNQESAQIQERLRDLGYIE
jgi:predicted AlkP superfamily phosphohydrolase/phosphomutase